ncbi:hypothetical protein ACOMICROBIO_NCLOACGD_01020 [Vibrio sp. B1ASS3]|nr:hypothetical protein ACOMICROBIO_NCLOACGD_01020 [Vibrio sp. B1ASS3]CAE6892943.1 hypothetical protein ACOMICROBIO_NCLOACGD_01020 [Vibrio sp. B1ASS3]
MAEEQLQGADAPKGKRGIRKMMCTQVDNADTV